MRLRRVAVSAFLLGVGVYVWLPTPDEIVIYPALSIFFSLVFNLNLAYAVLLSVILYRGIGSVCLLGAIILGGKQTYLKIKERLKRR